MGEKFHRVPSPIIRDNLYFDSYFNSIEKRERMKRLTDRKHVETKKEAWVRLEFEG